jgi:quinol monooxygenase YgiN
MVRLEAKPGKEEEVADFLRSAVPLVEDEPATPAWFALRFGQTSFAIMDAFPDESGREAHLNGPVAAALIAKADDLFAEPPVIERVDVLADVLRVPA